MFKRAYELNYGDVIEVNGLTLQYDHELFYEVEKDGVDEFNQSLYSRTGQLFTPEEINKF